MQKTESKIGRAREETLAKINLADLLAELAQYPVE